jgi:peptidoglycan hydrolase-like protein with peptidoglycan-binding domain
MAAADEQKEDKSGKGFAGLSAMVSDVDATVTRVEKSGPEPSPGTTTGTRTKPTPQAQPAKEPESIPQRYHQTRKAPSGGSSAGKWLLGIGAVIGLIWLLSESGNKGSPPAPTYSSSNQPSVGTTPAPTYRPYNGPVVPLDEVAPGPAQPQAPSRPSEEEPPVGTNHVLGPSQIRYCLAEDIRLEAAKGALNNYVESDVDRFNAMVAGYNNRCGQFRYRRGSLESAKAEIEGVRTLIQSEGRSRFSRSPSSETRQLPSRDIRPRPDPEVLAVQKRLNDLGYDAGVPDGLTGGKTRTAILDYQRDKNVPADGVVTGSLLEHLKGETSRHVHSRADIQQRPSSQQLQAAPSPIPPQSLTQEPLTKPDLSRANPSEQQAIERTCDGTRRFQGPADYYACLMREMNKLSASAGRPDLSRADANEQQAIERTCDGTRRFQGPGDYYACLTREMTKLSASQGRPDLSRANPSEQQAIERTCDGTRRFQGPADYYACMTRELVRLGHR